MSTMPSADRTVALPSRRSASVSADGLLTATDRLRRPYRRHEDGELPHCDAPCAFLPPRCDEDPAWQCPLIKRSDSRFECRSIACPLGLAGHRSGNPTK